MNQAVPDCLVENYEGYIDCLKFPDTHDRHVLAAVIKCNADVIVTNNLKDFPHDVISKYNIEAQSPDIFLSHLFDLNPIAFCSAVRQQKERLSNPRYSTEALLNIFYKQGLPLLVNELKGVIDLI